MPERDSQYATDLERQGYAVGKQFAAALQTKNVKAYFGWSWDGYTSHHADQEFWYFNPRGNGGVIALVEYDGGTYDTGFLDSRCARVLDALNALPENPSRDQIWAVFDVASDPE